MKSFAIIIFSLLLATQQLFACCKKDSITKDNYSKKKLIILSAGVNTLYIGSLIGLNEVWYKNNPRTSFHFFNDNSEWQQLDKVGHFTTAFHESVFAIKALKWTGLPEKKAVLIGSLAGFVYQTPIEILDGYAAEYGASWGDIIANTAGSALVLGQYLLWNDIRFQPKFSFHRTRFAPQRPNVLGSNLSEEILKDYNGQTYWLSFNISSFIKKEECKFPKWLNVAIGYGAENMLYAEKEKNSLNGYDSYRQYYLSLDVDLSHVKTKKKWIKYILYPLNIIHIPFPAVGIDKKGIKFHPLYF